MDHQLIISNVISYMRSLVAGTQFNILLKQEDLNITSIFGLKIQLKASSFLAISWSKHPQNVFKLNVDGSSLSNPGASGCGGIIRDHKGNFVYAFSHFVGHQYVFLLKQKL